MAKLENQYQTNLRFLSNNLDFLMVQTIIDSCRTSAFAFCNWVLFILMYSSHLTVLSREQILIL